MKRSDSSMDFPTKLKAGIKESYLLRWLVPYARKARQEIQTSKRKLSLAGRAWKYPTISRREFLKDVGSAVTQGTGYAAGKIGRSNQFWMHYEMLLENECDANKIAEFERDLTFHGLNQMGIFPAECKFYLKFNRFYVDHVRNLDCLGVCFYPGELEIIRYYGLKNKFLYYPQQEPDRSSPSDVNNCYLQYFRDKRLLIVCPFAELLKQRATKEIFEGVWSKTGKKWFYPKSVEALEFPYGFSAETHKTYRTVFDLFDDTKAKLHRKEFDVALIAAAGLAIPIASYIKSKGKIAIDLGGHLQIIFGVIGQRWRNLDDWKRDYFNEYWIDMPVKYKPKETAVCDNGAYW
jgi:hypothetical protein